MNITLAIVFSIVVSFGAFLLAGWLYLWIKKQESVNQNHLDRGAHQKRCQHILKKRIYDPCEIRFGCFCHYCCVFTKADFQPT